MALPTGQFTQVALMTLVGVVGWPILWRNKDWFDGQGDFMTRGVWIYALGVCGGFEVLDAMAR